LKSINKKLWLILKQEKKNMFKVRNLLLFTAIIMSFIKGIYFYFFSVIYKYLLFPIAVSIYIQILEKKKITLLLKRDVIIERKVYFYMFKGEITEQEECTDDVFFISLELMKKTYEKILLIKLFTYAGTMILGLCFMYFYPLVPEYTTFHLVLSIILIIHFYFFEIRKVLSLYKKIKSEDYKVIYIKTDDINYYSALIEKESKKGAEPENLYSMLF
jgi:hypothetical protein